MVAHYKLTEDISGRYLARDIKKSRVCAVIGYLFFFVPIIIFPDDGFCRYHANQSLILLLLGTIGITIVCLIPYVGWLLAILLAAFIAVCAIRGMILAATGKAKRIPLFGNLVLIEYEPRA